MLRVTAGRPPGSTARLPAGRALCGASQTACPLGAATRWVPACRRAGVAARLCFMPTSLSLELFQILQTFSSIAF